MRYLVVLAWTTGLAAGNSFESILQSRQSGYHSHFPQAFPLQDRSYLKFTPESYVLQRRADQSSSSRETGSRYPSPGQRRAKASITVNGPANISTTGTRGNELKKVQGGKTGHLQNHHPSHVIAGGRSTAMFPYGKEMIATARGQKVAAQVIPAPGTRGDIRFTVGGQTAEIRVPDRDGKYHTAEDFASGDAKVVVSTKNGGQVQAFAVNPNDPDSLAE